MLDENRLLSFQAEKVKKEKKWSLLKITNACLDLV